MPEWSTVQFSYAKLLREEGFREADANKFKMEHELGKSKAIHYLIVFRCEPIQEFEDECFPRIYRDSKRKIYDFRLAEQKPTLNN